MASKKKEKVKYQGKEYEVESSYEFANRTYYCVKGLTHALSENVLDKEPAE